VTGFFDATGHEFTPAELRARRASYDAASRQSRVVIELLDANGARVTTVAHPFPVAIAASVATARIIPDVPEDQAVSPDVAK
jgi:hypothetical protein